MKSNQRGAGSPSDHRKPKLRREWGILLFCLLMATALPALTARLLGILPSSREVGLTGEMSIRICCHGSDQSEETTISRALILSLAATNRSDTPAASLEAQAVVLRSRAVWWIDYCHGDEEDRQGESAQKGYHTLCDSPSHGIPYRSEQSLLRLWGEQETAARIAAAEQAVEATRGQVLCFEGEVIPAMLHGSSPKVTRGVEELPWLTSISTPEEPPVTVHRIAAEDARAALAARFGILLSADPREWEIATAPHEGVTETVRLGESQLTATLFADALGLPSGNLQMEATAEALIVTCTGEGSGCGLSRAGAAVYAAGGLSWGEILAHYYPDCTLGRVWK